MDTATHTTSSTPDQAAEFLICAAGRCGTKTGISPDLKKAVLDRSMLRFIWILARERNTGGVRKLMQIDEARAMIEGGGR